MERTAIFHRNIITAILGIILLASCVQKDGKTQTPNVKSLPAAGVDDPNEINPSLLAEWIMGRIQDITWSPDSKEFVVNSYLNEDESNNYVQAFDIPSLKNMWTAEDSLAMDLAFTPDGQFIIESNIFSPTLYFRSPTRGKVVRQNESDNCRGGGQFAIANSKNKTILLADTNDLIGLNTDHTIVIRQWDLNSGECTNLLEYQGSLDLFDLDTGGNFLAYGGEGKDGTAVIWDLENRTEMCRTKKIDYGRFIPGQNTLAVSTGQKIVFVDVSTCQNIKEFSVSTTGNHLAFTPDGRWFVVAGESIQIVETSTGKILAEIPILKNATIYSDKLFSGGIEFSPDGRHLAIAFSTGAYSGKVQLWKLKS